MPNVFPEIRRLSHHASVDEVSSHETPSVSLSRKVGKKCTFFFSFQKLQEGMFALQRLSCILNCISEANIFLLNQCRNKPVCQMLKLS